MTPQAVIEWSGAIGFGLITLGIGVAVVALGANVATSMIKEILPQLPSKGKLKPRKGSMTIGQYILLQGLQNASEIKYSPYDLRFDTYDPELIEKVLFPNGEPAPTPKLDGYTTRHKWAWEKEYK